MRRRPLIRALPAAGTLALAGCLDRARSTVGLQPDVRPLEDERPHSLPLFEDLGLESAPDGPPVEGVAVGSSDDTHWVAVAADSSEPVETTVAVRPADGDPLYETTVGLSTERYLAVKLQFVQDYAVAIASDRHRGGVDVPADLVDCNASLHAVLLAADGAVAVTSETTSMACESF